MFTGIWDEDAEKSCVKESRDTVVRTMQEAEKKKLPHWKEMLEDVYYDMPPRIQLVYCYFIFDFL